MILVTVGTHTQGFPRLIRQMDDIAADLAEEVVMQIGVTDYTPQHARFFRFAGQDELERLNEEADVVVTHAGVGSILTALGYGKPVIVVPRLAALGEHTDDHQLQITAALSASGQVVAVTNVSELLPALAAARSAAQSAPRSAAQGPGAGASAPLQGPLVAVVRRYVERLARPVEQRRRM